ncbi:MAG: carboxylate--amine ligase, partial [Firmicutes bacterium]|nr:carboxylate--amine ligase [Bacillota bacterium]
MSTGTNMEAIGRLLSPQSIALVGATENSFWSFSIIENLRTLGYQGAIHLVHPTKATQFGARCYPSVRDIPGPVDHAWVMTATGVAMSVLQDCAAKGIRSVTMLTAGFKEVGPEGARLERELVQFCRDHEMTLLGPNCLGFLNGRLQIPAYALLLGEAPIPGHIGVVLQSGALLLHFHRLAVNRGIGLSYLVSSGNEGMLDATDFLRFMVENPETKVVAALLEGIRDPQAFKEIADRAMALGKPMVVLKTGRSQAASRSATAHTGALTGVDAVVDAYLRQLGVLRVDSVEELVETAGLLQARGWPEAGRRAGVVTPSGGSCGIFADICHNKAIELPDFSATTKERLKEILPDFGTAQNPLDPTGYVVIDGTLIPRTLEVIARAPECDMVVVVTDPPTEPGLNPQRTRDRLERLAAAVAGSSKYVCLVSTVAGELTKFGRSAVAEFGLHTANGLTLGAAALDRAIRYGEARGRYLARNESASPLPDQTDRSDRSEAFKGRHGALNEA